MLAAKAGASHELLRKLLDAYAAEPDAAEIEVLLCGIGDQARMLRDGRADVALMHAPFDALAGFDTEELLTEGQVAVLPAGHPLAARTTLTLADISDVPDLPLARWPRQDGTYEPGPGPEIHDQSQLAQLIALGRTVAVFPDSARSWLWSRARRRPPDRRAARHHLLAWPPHSRSRAVAGLVRTATRL